MAQQPVYPKKLMAEELRWTCSDSNFKFKTTKEIEPLDTIVGQERAIESIRMGALILSPGYNVFVSGLSGTGRLTTVKKILEEVADFSPTLNDFCYVNNFENNDHPRLIKLPKGQGKEFAKVIDDAIVYLKGQIPKLYEDQKFQASRKKIIEKYQKKEREILEDFDTKIRTQGFVRGQVETDQGVTQPEVFPVIDKQTVQIENLDELVASGKLSEKRFKEIRKLYLKFHDELTELSREDYKIMQEFRQNLSDHDKGFAQISVESVLDRIAETFNTESVGIFIKEVKQYILDNLIIFFTGETTPEPQQEAEGQQQRVQDKFSPFYVNIILDNSNTDKAPVIVETTPNYIRLFGTIERIYDNRGFWRSDFSKIKAGSLLMADQGYLIVNADDLMNEPGVWNALKRVLLYNRIEIQTWDSFFNISQSHLKPDPIDVNIKVIIIGGQTLYKLLYMYEKGFKKIFKVNAQFDYETQNKKNFFENYAGFISKICSDENLPHCDPSGVAAITEWASEHAGTQGKLTLKFSDMADVLREAAFYQKKHGSLITRQDVNRAINSRRFRNNMVDEKIRQSITDGDMLIDTDGERVGQINGLTVYDTGLLSFGKPARITATISVGNAGIINIEREVEMSGAIHNKGVLIISGYLRDKFAKEHPMSLTASIAFEQSYGGIDGDSASAAEIYVLLLAISGIPITQSIAITGSVNQMGDIQPIGGVNEKITGFYEICRDRGLNKKNGVIIPVQNVKDLMLPPDIVEAVRKGKFSIWAIKRVEDGISLVMGRDAGARDKHGKFPKTSVYGIIEQKLKELHKLAKESLGDEKAKSKAKKSNILEDDDSDI
jgi:ATP-dependent Lon protease